MVNPTVDHIWLMSREDPPLRIRLPAALKSAVQARAAENRRSMNAEIVRRLEWSLEAEQDHQPGQDSVRRLLQAGLPAEITNSDRIAKLERRLAELERKSK